MLSQLLCSSLLPVIYIYIPKHHLPSWWNYYIRASLVVKPYSFVCNFLSLSTDAFIYAENSLWGQLCSLSTSEDISLLSYNFSENSTIFCLYQWEICLVSLREFKRFSLTLIFSIFGTVWITFFIGCSMIMKLHTFSSNVTCGVKYNTNTHTYVQDKTDCQRSWREDLELQTPQSTVMLN